MKELNISKGVCIIGVVALHILFILNQAEDPILSPGRVGMNAINCKNGLPAVLSPVETRL